ncbi:MAG: MFS transporter [Alphaproteobacteria bacterium]
MPDRDRLHFLLLNVGHFLDHMFTLIFATVAALALVREWGMGYGDLLKYATPGFFAFGLFAYPAGWIADKWSREGMMVAFFVGIGAAAIATGFAQSPLQIGIGLFAIGIFAAVYHPVGLAIVVAKWKNTGMRIAVNGVWGNLGVASAALITGYLIDNGGWRIAFIAPGVFSILVGLAYAVLRRREIAADNSKPKPAKTEAAATGLRPRFSSVLLRISVIVFVTTAISSIVFQSTTFALPKIFAERLQDVGVSLAAGLGALGLPGRADIATVIGSLAFVVFAVASMAQLVVGSLLDRYGPRPVFMTVAAIQVVFFAVMPAVQNWAALAVALGFMLGAFGQIPINDYMIGKMAQGEARARIYAVRYVVSFTALAAALPLIAFVYEGWGFDALFQILALTAFAIFITVSLLPRRMPVPAAATA